MSARSASKHRTAAQRQATPDAAEFKPPLRPHRKLFIALFAVFVIWMGVLLGLYFKTVYPVRHGGGAATRAVQ